jgi:putative transposase
MTAFIVGHKDEFGVEPICDVLQFAPQTYYAAVTRPPSAREVHDGYLKEAIEWVWVQNHSVYGADKVWAQLRRDRVPVARCTVERLMRACGRRGVVRGKRVRTTVAGAKAAGTADLVDRRFRAEAPNRLWVADLTYVKTHSGWVYVAFILDVYSRRVVGWQTSRSLRTDLALDALEMAFWTRRGECIEGLIHHSDRGVQYVDIRYTDRLAEAGGVRSVGSKGDSYDNAMAESFNGLYKSERIYKDGPWYGLEDVEHTTMDYVHWFNHERLHGEIGMGTPVEKEAEYRQSPPIATSAIPAQTVELLPHLSSSPPGR